MGRVGGSPAAARVEQVQGVELGVAVEGDPIGRGIAPVEEGARMGRQAQQGTHGLLLSVCPCNFHERCSSLYTPCWHTSLQPSLSSISLTCGVVLALSLCTLTGRT